jgi:hypothetical protein
VRHEDTASTDPCHLHQENSFDSLDSIETVHEEAHAPTRTSNRPRSRAQWLVDDAARWQWHCSQAAGEILSLSLTL